MYMLQAQRNQTFLGVRRVIAAREGLNVALRSRTRRRAEDRP